MDNFPIKPHILPPNIRFPVEILGKRMTRSETMLRAEQRPPSTVAPRSKSL